MGAQMINLYNQDCLQALRKMETNQFELAICDPPYGIANREKFQAPRGNKGIAQEMKNRVLVKQLKKMRKWDIAPPPEYFIELRRVSKNQIIWGGNYFDLPPTRGVIAWDKVQPWYTYSQWEMAWTSFDTPARLFKFDNRTGGKIHATQKPVQLYLWLLSNYANAGDRILDTHLGSGSIALACHDMGFDLEAYEIDKDYFKAASKRLKDHQKQLRLF